MNSKSISRKIPTQQEGDEIHLSIQMPKKNKDGFYYCKSLLNFRDLRLKKNITSIYELDAIINSIILIGIDIRSIKSKYNLELDLDGASLDEIFPIPKNYDIYL